MNFPHKRLAKTSADADVNAASAHDVLIAHAIARQSLSPSARAYIACRNGSVVKPAHASRGLVEDRIKFFAGELRPGSSFAKSERIFENGHFWPDLLRGSSSGGVDEE
ncbi:MAG: hypothetical protein V7676_07765 [Parasphingorhabdus sp.]|uniref:hypothetical protein n=1 Tax=Parasphingorhabdus sp. TaxID=2709688 RepID=UPI00300343B4